MRTIRKSWNWPKLNYIFALNVEESDEWIEWKKECD